jgi:hypothetical protein
VLLVDDDQAEVGKRQEERRTRADDDARPRRRRSPRQPCRVPHRAGVSFGMPDSPARRRSGGLKRSSHCRGQGDFRQQHQRLAPCRQGRGDRLEIDLGLARAGDAVEQRRARKPAAASAPLGDERRSAVRRMRLRRRQLRSRPAPDRAREIAKRRGAARATRRDQAGESADRADHTAASPNAARARSAAMRGGPSRSTFITRAGAPASRRKSVDDSGRVVRCPSRRIGDDRRGAAPARRARSSPCAAPRPAASACRTRPSRSNLRISSVASAAVSSTSPMTPASAWTRAATSLTASSALIPHDPDHAARAERHLVTNVARALSDSFVRHRVIVRPRRAAAAAARA